MDERDALNINGRLAARWARRTVERLRRERNDINAINVFPVADGDTGSNLYHTVRSAYRAVENLRGAVTLSDVIGAMATGALRGARGNSGLILSVALRGVADALDGVTDLDGPTFAGALELAAARARTAVATPVDGTMLTVLEAMAAEARSQADAGADLIGLIAAVRESSQQALLETTGQLPALSEANVVDAGSSGIVELFDLLYLTITGEDPADHPALHAAHLTATTGGSTASGTGAGTEANTAEECRGPSAPALLHTGEQGFELVFYVAERRDRTRRVKKTLTAGGGDSIVVSWPMIHVHVPSEDAALETLRACADLGIERLRVEDLSVTGGRSLTTTVIAAGSGVGMLFACALQDAHAVNADGPAVAEQIDELIADAGAPVIVVPDSAHLLGELRRRYGHGSETAGSLGSAAGGARQPVSIVRSRSAAAVLSALAVYDSTAPAAEAFEDMAESASATRVGAVVRAERSSAGPLIYDRSDLLTIIDGRIRSVEQNPAAAVIACADRLLGAGGEVMTIVTGAQLPASAVDALLRHVETRHPLVTVDIVRSEHPEGCAVLGVE
ncbi:DAK2 domain-containing protein [Brevibacterium sp. p3-SID960]|uniref:DAK2 domain-containing protein n=1 Tax=Brevibacterium sp. p3-SID960 TaxID=2916063 RepID=UPI0021A57825|nr:DAK2 domain-containing protein [Brevibacterium sp. p3-SID960]MCT1690829.1 DAK2 domain-containing protein [Brevibacterium sp. p3-SID960]